MPNTIENGVPLGEMGWGIKNEPVEKWFDEEKRGFDRIAQLAPQTLIRGEAKPVNEDLMKKIKDIMGKNGIDDGFCMLALEEAIFGSELTWLAQLIGSCVASGDMATTTDRKLVEVYLLNDPEDVGGTSIVGVDNIAPFAPYNYRAGRRIAGINGYSDGSLCVPHIQGKMQFGHLPCSTPALKSDRFPEPTNQSLYKSWGSSREGDALMAKYATNAKTFPLLRTEKVDDADEGKTLLTDFYAPQNICSMWSFVPDYQHPTWKWGDGTPVWIYKRGRRPWAHNMQIISAILVKGRWYIIVRNQWDKAHKGRRWFPIPIELFGDWLRSAQCQSVSELDMTDNGPAWPEHHPA